MALHLPLFGRQGLQEHLWFRASSQPHSVSARRLASGNPAAPYRQHPGMQRYGRGGADGPVQAQRCNSIRIAIPSDNVSGNSDPLSQTECLVVF